MITQKELKSILKYNKKTGLFVSKIKRGNLKIGDIAGNLDKKYIRIRIHGKVYQAHRLVWLYVFGRFPEEQIDHVNQVMTDNRFKNLREVTGKDNMKNKTKYSSNKSGVVGVAWREDRNKWRVTIGVDGKEISIGCYAVFSDAVNARKLAEVTYGYHKNHGGKKNGR